jgi:general secretion pathway protein K
VSTAGEATFRRGLPARQRGIALIMVLWLTVMLAVVGGAFAFSMRSEVLAARNAVSIAQVRAAADGAIDRTVLELLRPRTKESWKADGQHHRWKDGDMLLVASAVDEGARIDLNTAAEPLLKNVFVVLGEIDDAAASALVDAIVDWRDADDLRRPSGAEAPDYRAANSNYTPTNRDFETIGELSRVLGVTPALYAKVAGVLTVHSRQRGVNSLTASRNVLLACRSPCPWYLRDSAWRPERQALLLRCVTGVTALQTAMVVGSTEPERAWEFAPSVAPAAAGALSCGFGSMRGRRRLLAGRG